MNLRSLSRGLLYRGEVEGQKQTYYVLEGTKFYLVMSFSKVKNNAGNFNVVDAETIEYVLKKFKGHLDLTAKMLFQNSKKPNYVGSNLQALNILYVLSAIRKARIDRRYKDRELHFNVR